MATGASVFSQFGNVETLPLIFSTEVTNLAAVNAQVAVSPSSEKYGKYLDAPGLFWFPIFQQVAPGEQVTVTALIKPRVPYQLASFHHPYLAPVLYHGSSPLGTKISAVTYSEDEPPIWLTFEYVRGPTGNEANIAFAGRLFALSVTRTNGQPVSDFRPHYERAGRLQSLEANNLTPSGATFATTANPQNDGPMSVSFEFGTDVQFTGARRTYNTVVPNGGTDAPVSQIVQDLTPGMIYFYRTQTMFSGDPEPVLGDVRHFLAPPFGSATSAIGIKRLASGRVLLGMFGIPGITHTVSASTNFTNWLPIATVIAGPSGSFSYEDSDAELFPRRFYRVTAP